MRVATGVPQFSTNSSCICCVEKNLSKRHSGNTKSELYILSKRLLPTSFSLHEAQATKNRGTGDVFASICGLQLACRSSPQTAPVSVVLKRHSGSTKSELYILSTQWLKQPEHYPTLDASALTGMSNLSVQMSFIKSETRWVLIGIPTRQRQTLSERYFHGCVPFCPRKSFRWRVIVGQIRSWSSWPWSRG